MVLGLKIFLNLGMRLNYTVAELNFSIITEAPVVLRKKSANLEPFLTDKENDTTIFTLEFNQEIKLEGEMVYEFSMPTMAYRLYKKNDKDYFIHMIDTVQQKASYVAALDNWSRIYSNSSEESISTLLFSNILMFAFSFSSASQHTLMMHSSVVEYENKAYLFLGQSGTGKSTHTKLWLKHFKGSSLLNDDNPIIRIIDEEVFVFGSPWSGKTPCYKNRKATIGAITRLEQAPENQISERKGALAFACIYPSSSKMQWDELMLESQCDTIKQVVNKVSIYHLKCLPNKKAAELSLATLTKR